MVPADTELVALSARLEAKVQERELTDDLQVLGRSLSILAWGGIILHTLPLFESLQSGSFNRANVDEDIL